MFGCSGAKNGMKLGISFGGELTPKPILESGEAGDPEGEWLVRNGISSVDVVPLLALFGAAGAVIGCWGGCGAGNSGFAGGSCACADEASG